MKLRQEQIWQDLCLLRGKKPTYISFSTSVIHTSNQVDSSIQLLLRFLYSIYLLLNFFSFSEPYVGSRLFVLSCAVFTYISKLITLLTSLAHLIFLFLNLKIFHFFSFLIENFFIYLSYKTRLKGCYFHLLLG